MSLHLPRLYPIVNVESAAAREFERCRALASAVARAGAPMVQLRAKSLAAEPFAALAALIVGDLRDGPCRVIVNDRVDIALAVGAAGVHLGDEDLPVAAARGILGASAIIGLSTHSLEEALAANATVGDGTATANANADASDSGRGDKEPRGPDYIGFGPVFDSPTKRGVRSPRGLGVLREICERSDLPVVAIGGIDTGNAAEVFAAGAASAAVISDLAATGDPAALIARYAR